eukprot:COSAG02_NODE_290_length_25531_cov_75.132392_4_plen_837_part_00
MKENGGEPEDRCGGRGWRVVGEEAGASGATVGGAGCGLTTCVVWMQEIGMFARNPSEQDLQGLAGLGSLSRNPSFSDLDSLKSLQWDTIDTSHALAAAGPAGEHDDDKLTLDSPTGAMRVDSVSDPFGTAYNRRVARIQPRERPCPAKRSRRNVTPSAKRVAAERDAAAAVAEQRSSSHMARVKKERKPPATSPHQDQAASSDITLQACMHLLQSHDGSLQERPAHISEEVDPYLLFMEAPKLKRTTSLWGGTAARIDRWANSGGVSGAHDYFPSAGAGRNALGVRKRYGRIVRQGMQLLKFFEFTLIRKGDGDDSTNTEDKSCVLFQVFSETSRAAPGKRHWETAEARESVEAEPAADTSTSVTGDYPIASDEVWEWREKELQRLKELYECGLLTDDVYDEEQRRALHVQQIGKRNAPLPQDKDRGEGYGRLESAGELLDAIGQHSPDAQATVASVIAPLDALLKASTMMLGVEGASIITSAYEETSTSDDMWWKTALQWWCIGESAKNAQGRSAATAVWRKCLTAFDKMSRNAPPEVQKIYDFVELYCVQAVLLSMDDPADIHRYRPRLDHLSQTEQGQQPESAGTIAGLILTLDVMPALMDAGDIPRANAGLMRMIQVYFSVARSENIDDEAVKLKHLRSAVWTGTAFKDILVLSPEFTWGLFGEQGELITQAIETAHAEAPTTRALTASGSSYTESVYAAYPVFAPLALVWVELDTANRCIDMQLAMLRTNIARIDNDRSESLTLLHAGYMWPTMLHIVGRDADATQLLRNLKMGWDTTDETVDRLAENVGHKVFRKRGASTGRHVNDVGYYSVMIRVSLAAFQLVVCSVPM